MLGMTTVTFRNKSVEEIIDITKKSGLSAIEWGGDIHVPHSNIESAKNVAFLTNEAGLKVASYGSYFRVGVDRIDDFDKILETAKALSAPIIRIWCGNTQSKDTSETTVNNYINDIRYISKKAEKHGIIIASEFHKGTYNDSLESAVNLIERVDMQNYKTYWQPFNGFDRLDEESLIGLLPYIVTVHVFAWNRYGKRFNLKRHAKKWQRIIEICREQANINFIMEFVKGDSDKNFLKDSTTLLDIYNKVMCQ